MNPVQELQQNGNARPQILLSKSAFWHTSLDVFIRSRDADKTHIQYATAVEMQDQEIGTAMSPVFQLDLDDAQILMDNLWDCGVRPSEGVGSAGSLKATQDHLVDMREILHHQLGIKSRGAQ